MNYEQIVDFEKDIQNCYEDGEIRGPIHLRDGNEQQLIDIFKNVKNGDYVFSTWANHIHALLKGVPPEAVKNRILESQSMAMNFPQHRFFCPRS
jgi:TPP-dependent pyruvate/acetoin dehydrogenase alpha subunit